MGKKSSTFTQKYLNVIYHDTKRRLVFPLLKGEDELSLEAQKRKTLITLEVKNCSDIQIERRAFACTDELHFYLRMHPILVRLIPSN